MHWGPADAAAVQLAAARIAGRHMALAEQQEGESLAT
jgi:hypothetical protein